MRAGTGRVVILALTLVLTGPLAGCQALGGSPSGNDKKSTNAPQASHSPGPNEITASRSGVFHEPGSETWFKLDIYRVERYERYSVLRFALINLEDTPASGNSFDGFRLLDPIGQRIYFTLRKGDYLGEAFGSQDGYDIQYRQGVRYRGVLYFPQLPEHLKWITVLSPTGNTTGEFTGIPVVDGSGKPSVNKKSPPPTPKRGQTVKLPTNPPRGDVWSNSKVLYSRADSSTARTNVSSPGKQKVSLRADVLFAFDSAELSDRAKAIIRKVAPELSKRADPSKPVVIEGHTDDKGSDAYNEDLSQRRAEAVHEELTSALGESSPFRFTVTGKGETEPVAKNTSEEGRTRNRRVEIEYATKPRGNASTGTASGSSAGPVRPAVGAPAPFHAKDGRVVATRRASVDQVGASPTNLTLEVHPFYRDGAYLVAVFEVAADGLFVGSLDAPGLIGAGFGAFTVVAPATRNRYYEVRIGKSDDSIHYVDSGGLGLDGGDSGRHFVYYPAPPPGVTKVTFDAGPFGTIKNVPIR